LSANWPSELHLAWQGQLGDLVTSVACSPSGRGWAASSAAGEVVWNAGLGALVSLQSAAGSAISRVAFSADGRWLAAGGQAGKLAIWNCDRADELPPQLVTTISIGEWIEQLVWHPTEPYLAVSYGAQIAVWELPIATAKTAWKFDRSSVFDLAWHPDGEYIAAAGYKGVQIWSASEPDAPSFDLAIETTSLKLAWSADGRYLAMGNLDRTLTVTDWQQPDERWTLQGCPGKIRQLAWLNGTATPSLAVASGETIVLWELSVDATTWHGLPLEGHQDIVTATIAHPSAPMLVSGGADGYACLWTVAGSIEQILTLPLLSGFTAINWHPQALYLATGTRTGTIGIWIIPA
jgi:WD40 repeat protein